MRVCVFWILRVLNSWGLEISGLLDLWALFFGVLRIWRLWIFGPFVFRDLWIFFFGILGCWIFSDSLWIPVSQKWVSSTFIFSQEAASSIPRQGIDVFFAVCALERPRQVLATDPGDTIYLTGNLDETEQNNLRNQMQRRSCQLRNASQKGLVLSMLRFKPSVIGQRRSWNIARA